MHLFEPKIIIVKITSFKMLLLFCVLKGIFLEERKELILKIFAQCVFKSYVKVVEYELFFCAVIWI